MKLIRKSAAGILSILALAGSAGAQLVISGYNANTAGTDSPYEYVQLVAVSNIDFSVTPMSVVVLNNGTATTNGWAQGLAISYKFNITSGTMSPGNVAYVGGSGKLINGSGSTDISGANWLRAINTATTAGDGLGSLNGTGVFGNGGTYDGIGVFMGTNVYWSSIPQDAVFFGTTLGTGSTVTNYNLPVNDLYNGGKLQSGSTVFGDPPNGGFVRLTGTFDSSAGAWTTARTATTVTLTTTNTLPDIASAITVLTGPSGPTISYGASSTTNQYEGNGPVTVNVQLSIEGTGSVQIASAGTATLDSDFTLSATNFDFTAGNSTQTLTITISDDAAIEATETVSLSLANPTGGTLGSPTNFSFTLLDNDQVTVQFDATNAADTAENGGPLSVNVQLSQTADATVQVATAGSALPGTDYTLSSTQIVFTAGGATLQAVTITLTDDVLPESTESVALSLANASGAALQLQTNFAFNILDNEPAVRFAVSSATTGESSGTVDVVVYKTSTNNTVTGNLTIGGTAMQGGGADYTIAATNFTLDGATTSATVTITLVNDSVSEGDETVTLALADVAAASVTTPSTFTLTITDDDPAAPLYAGDIALIGRINNTVPDTFALVALTNLSPGQVIYFTDNGWDSSLGSFRGAAAFGKGNEDIMKLTINSNLAAGTIIQAYDVSNPAWSWVATNSAIPGTNSTFNTPNYSQSGDQTCVFTAPRNSPLQNPTTHIFVLDDTHGFEDATTTAFGNEPPGLSSNAYTALSFDFTNLAYAALNMTSASTQTLTKAQWLVYIADVANWTTGASGSLPSGTISVVNPGAPPPTPYETWLTENGIGAGQETGDADTDGYLNLLEYATGAQPTNANSGAQMNAQAGVVPMKFVFSRNTNAVDVTLVVEAANDVTNDVPWFGIATNINGSWGAATNVTETIAGSPVTVTVTDTEAAATNRYMRLRVTKP